MLRSLGSLTSLLAAAGMASSVVSRQALAPRRLNEDGLPIHEGTPKRNKHVYSVAQGKRMARKARNVKRHKAASRG